MAMRSVDKPSAWMASNPLEARSHMNQLSGAWTANEMAHLRSLAHVRHVPPKAEDEQEGRHAATILKFSFTALMPRNPAFAHPT
jgi:hypothetical protein